MSDPTASEATGGTGSSAGEVGRGVVPTSALVGYASTQGAAATVPPAPVAVSSRVDGAPPVGAVHGAKRSRVERARRRTAAGFGRIDRSNRIILFVLGVISALAGILVLLAGGGTFSWGSPADLWRHISANAIAHPDWWAGVGSFICLVVFVLALWWVGRQFVPGRTRERLGIVTIDRSALGRTTVATSGVADALSRDLVTVAGVSVARVRLRSLRPAHLVAVVDISVATDAATLYQSLDGPFARACPGARGRRRKCRGARPLRGRFHHTASSVARNA